MTHFEASPADLGDSFRVHLRDLAIDEAAMILTGMGPVDQMTTTGGKLFATFYALYRGIAFLTIMAVVLAPLIHRLLHKFHLNGDDEQEAT